MILRSHIATTQTFDLPASLAVAGGVATALAALITATLAIVAAARRPSAIDRLLELDTHLDGRRRPALRAALSTQIERHAAELLAKRRIRHPFAFEAVLWGVITVFLGVSTAEGTDSATATFARGVGYVAGGILILITVGIEITRAHEQRRLLRAPASPRPDDRNSARTFQSLKLSREPSSTGVEGVDPHDAGLFRSIKSRGREENGS